MFESAKMVQSSVATPPDSLFTDNTSAPVLGSDYKDDPDYAVGDEGDDILMTRSDNNGKGPFSQSFRREGEKEKYALLLCFYRFQ